MYFKVFIYNNGLEYMENVLLKMDYRVENFSLKSRLPKIENFKILIQPIASLIFNLEYIIGNSQRKPKNQFAIP